MTRPGAWPYPRLLAHRCGGTLAPENTLAGLRAAARAGCRGVEFDVMLSGSGTPVLIHDESWNRTTDGAGRVAETPDEEIARLDAGSWFGPAFAGEPVPTFEQAARLCRELGLATNVEIKPAAGQEAATGRAVALAAARLWQGDSVPPLLSSFSAVALSAARQAGVSLPLGLLVETIPDDWHERMAQLGCFSLHCDVARNGLTCIAAIARRGVPVLCYTVNDRERAAELLGAGASAVVSDRVDLMDFY